MDATLENQGFFKMGNCIHHQRILSMGEKGQGLVVTSQFVTALINLGNISLEEVKLLILGFLRDLPLSYNSEIALRIKEDRKKEEDILKKLRNF